jgi:hypothetical protein
MGSVQMELKEVIFGENIADWLREIETAAFC